jgi:hypothetical protein
LGWVTRRNWFLQVNPSSDPHPPTPQNLGTLI